MKDYILSIDWLQDDCGKTSDLWSKGHHDFKEFEKACEEIGYLDGGLKLKNIRHLFGKKCGYFEDGERKGCVLSQVKELESNNRGWFPITIADVAKKGE